MNSDPIVKPSDSLKNVRYEIRGRLARRAHELERQGYEIISLNIGNPRLFGFRTPETMRLAMIENLSDAEGYCHQKGIFPAREAVVMQQQARGVTGVSAEEVFIGNGVSELIDMVLRALLEGLARLAERHKLIVFSDEIYDQMVYDDAESIPMATLVHDTLCATLSGLSKIYRACGYRVGWASFSGRLRGAGDYLAALELLSSLRLCSNVPAQWAVQTALGGYQSIREIVSPGGRLYESRRAIIEAGARSRYLRFEPPK